MVLSDRDEIDGVAVEVVVAVLSDAKVLDE
jgi:hypothetical protein